MVKKWVRPQDTNNKENAMPSKKFNSFDKGRGVQFEEKNRDEGLFCGKIPMQDDPIHLRCDSALATNE